MTIAGGCACEGFIHPAVLTNPPGLRRIDYRAGDFLAFRHALLSARDGELELNSWRPGAEGDLAVQLVEWWAYVADVLAFYNERAISASLLRTAEHDEDLRNLVRIVGYRPRPAIAATGIVAAIAGGTKTITLPLGLKIESKPGPGKQPQTFEVGTDTSVAPPGEIAVDPAPDTTFSTEDGLLVKGVVSSIVANEKLLLVHREWTGLQDDLRRTIVTVRSTATEVDPRGSKNTRVTVDADAELNGNVDEYRLFRSTQMARLRFGNNAITDVEVRLATLYRDIQVGSPLLIEHDGSPPKVVKISGYREDVYYANGTVADPETEPAEPATPVPVLNSALAFPVYGPEVWTSATDGGKTIVRFDWRDAAELVAKPATGIVLTATGTADVVPATDPGPLNATSLFIEDAAGAGASVTATKTNGTVELSFSAPVTLAAPLRLLSNQVPVSRGKTVSSEVLGSGDASVASQDFVLKKSPVTYLADAESRSGELYSSTIRLYVDGLEWHEVPQLYGQSPTARVFVTWEDADGKTHVRTGDGVAGARLPSGTANVTATYRYGAGAATPDDGALTVIVDPWPGLKSIRNPVPVGGGSDADAADRLADLAPRSVLTFGRAVSAADFETIAGSAPGVGRVRSYWSFNVEEQRERLTLYVGDDAAAVASARSAIAAAAEDSDDALVLLATATALTMMVRVAIDPDRVAATVEAGVRSALAALFSASSSRIGAALYRSAIHAACLGVAGVVAVQQLTIDQGQAFRLDPGTGSFFTLAGESLAVVIEVADAR